MQEINKDKRDELYNKLITDKNFLYLFDLLREIKKQEHIYVDKTSKDSEQIYAIEDHVINRIMEECNLFVDEYDLFLLKNNLTHNSPTELIEKLKIEQNFTNDYAARDAFWDLLSIYSNGDDTYTKEQLIRQFVFWDENVLFGEECEFVEFHYKDPRYRVKTFTIGK